MGVSEAIETPTAPDILPLLVVLFPETMTREPERSWLLERLSVTDRTDGIVIAVGDDEDAIAGDGTLEAALWNALAREERRGGMARRMRLGAAPGSRSPSSEAFDLLLALGRRRPVLALGHRVPRADRRHGAASGYHAVRDLAMRWDAVLGDVRFAWPENGDGKIANTPGS
ncbi:MAG: hypothetical protein K2P80_05160 [Beijerinckiaceae bacterium]|nr:hypothetical protein [Beijerinckiaceae bacterium]